VRLRLMAKSKSLWQSLETPRETMLRHVWAEVRLAYLHADGLTDNLAFPSLCPDCWYCEGCLDTRCQDQ
jgi:hypothetical protein